MRKRSSSKEVGDLSLWIVGGSEVSLIVLLREEESDEVCSWTAGDGLG
jgi:hypothetical protein